MPTGFSRGIADPNAIYVLRLLGETAAMHVNHGNFWPEPAGTDLGTAACWDGWARKNNTPTDYLISDGYGGRHALLLSFDGGIRGNVWPGTSPGPGVQFPWNSGTYNPNLMEWVHWCWHWDGATIRTFMNGICDGATAWAGPRVSGGNSSGANVLYVGGSDHSNGAYDVAYMRAFDRGQQVHSIVGGAFVPPRFPVAQTSNNTYQADFLCDYTVPWALIDQSPRGVSTTADPAAREFHHGRLFTNLTSFTDRPEWAPSRYARQPTGAWLLDPTCPFRRAIGEHDLPLENIPSPATPSGSPLAYDSFGRRNQTFAFQTAPTLGSTEAGSAGVLPWQTGVNAGSSDLFLQQWGILGGKAVFMGTTPCIAFLTSIGTANQDVRAKRGMGAADNKETSVCCRVGDKDNYWCAYALQGSNIIKIGERTAGVWTQAQAPGPVTSSHAWLRMTAVGTTIKVYTGDGSSWTQVGTDITSSTHQSNTGVGFASLPPSGAFTSLPRWEEFAVYAG